MFNGCLLGGSRLARRWHPLASGPAVGAVRWHFLWWKRAFTPFYFEFNPHYQLRHKGLKHLLTLESGRRKVMRRVLKDSKFLGWGHQTRIKRDNRLNYPL